MKYKADLHIHTVLSPCGDIEMSPQNIVRSAIDKGMDIIAITDHNSTRQCRSVLQAAEETSLVVIPGVEITTKEEVHCLAYFGCLEHLDTFQAYLDQHLPDIKNDVERFGYQVVVDADENITYEEEKLLITAITQNIDEVAQKVHELGGLFVPAHINKPKYSLLSQLGFIPLDLKADAFELSKHVEKNAFIKQQKQLQGQSILQSSDAHIPEDIGTIYNLLEMEAPTFEGLKKSLKKKDKVFL